MYTTLNQIITHLYMHAGYATEIKKITCHHSSNQSKSVNIKHAHPKTISINEDKKYTPND